MAVWSNKKQLQTGNNIYTRTYFHKTDRHTEVLYFVKWEIFYYFEQAYCPVLEKSWDFLWNVGNSGQIFVWLYFYFFCVH